MQRKLICSAGEQRNLKFTLVLITWVVSLKGFDWAYSFSGDGFPKFIISLSSLAPQANFLNPIHTGGEGVFSTSKPVNCSELQNDISYNLETW